MGFNQFRLEVKIEKSKKLLNKTPLNINQIAYKLGYKNTESFNRAFKRLMHCTPTEYRKYKIPQKRHDEDTLDQIQVRSHLS